MKERVELLERLFDQLKVKAEIKSCKEENSFLIFDILLDAGGTFSNLEKFSTEIALTLKALSEPLIYPITREGIIRMEVLISDLDIVRFDDIVNSKEFLRSDAVLPLALGCCRDGSPLVLDLVTMPHLLIGGTTGSGKSIMLHSIINSLLLQKNVKFALIDPKRVEFSYYENMKNLYGPVAHSADESIDLLNQICEEMEARFVKLSRNGCRNISEYRGKMPYIVTVIDELSDLMMASKKETQNIICKLAQKSRACGIHLVVATQRPSADVVTGLIKANFPVRIGCQVNSGINSRILLDRGGAERLSGKGDAIIDCPTHRFKRFKGSFLDGQDIMSNVNIKKSWREKIWYL